MLALYSEAWGVLEACWAVLGGRLGRFFSGLGRCQNALVTFQEAPERKSLIFQRFLESIGWGSGRVGGGEGARAGAGTP